MEDATIVSQTDSLQLGSASRSICPVCQKQFSQYTCPRCNMRYCSLHCYKSHNSRCSEAFMRENVEDELRQVQPDEESKRRMLDILKKFHEEDTEEEVSMDEDVGLSDDTVQKVISGVHLNYDDLSTEEKKLFQRAMASGELSKMIKPWEPWWHQPSAHTISLGRDGTQLVQPIITQEEAHAPAAMSLQEREDEGTNHSDLLEFRSEIPPGPEAPLQPIKKLSSTEPSPLLAVHLVDILYSYCFTLRLYNGDWKSDPIGASTTVLSLSSVLGGLGPPEIVVDAVSRCLEQTCSPEFKHIGGLRFGFCLLDDVVSLVILGGKALVCALCDLERMLQAGEKEMKLKKRKGGKGETAKSKMKLAERKIYFIMCWVNEQMEEVWSSLGALVKAEKATVLEYHGSKPGAVPSTKAESRSSRNTGLIEEVQ